MSLKRVFDEIGWDWYGLGLWRDRLKSWMLDQKKLGIGIGVALFLILPLVCSLPRPQAYNNRTIGYALTVPVGWEKKVSPDKLTLTLTQKNSYPGNSEITVKAELGNPYGDTGFDYVYNGIYPRLNYLYGEQSVRMRDEPYSRTKNGLDWGIMSFTVDYEDYYLMYATILNEYVLTFTLKTSGGKNQAAAEKDFDKIIHSLTVKNKERVNVFMNTEESGLFEHPL